MANQITEADNALDKVAQLFVPKKYCIAADFRAVSSASNLKHEYRQLLICSLA